MPTVLITGANRGLGFELARQYAQDGWHVIGCCRAPEAADDLQALAGTVQVEKLDVSDFEAIDALAAKLDGTAIDVLINNAGYYGPEGFADGGMKRQAFGNMDYTNWRAVMDINVFSLYRMCEAFVPHVAASEQKKIINVSSMLGSIEDNTFGGSSAYRSSKAAVNMITRTIACEVKKRGIIVTPIQPGWNKTDMGGKDAHLEPSESMTSFRKVVANLTLDDSGVLFDWDGTKAAW